MIKSRVKRYLVPALLTIVAVIDRAQADFTPVYQPVLDISRAAGEIKVDGFLEDPGWRGAGGTDNFVENQPGDMIEPAVRTQAAMTYDDDNLYVAMVCYDDPTEIRASYCERDQLWTGQDMVGFFVDSYGDAAWAYTFNVNPFGVQMDALWSSGTGSEEVSYDLVWESAGRITDSGYQVEMAIPFSSLRFPEQDAQTWHIEFYRHRFREAHFEYSWAAYRRGEPCWPCQWGTVAGLRGVRGGMGIEFIPALLAYQSGMRASPGPDGVLPGFDNADPDGEASVFARYAPSSELTVEATVNPDFSQIEADAAQVEINSQHAISYPERRPFFQEGSDIYNTWVNTYHSRSINDPLVAAKVTARRSRTSLAFTAARDETSPYVIPFEESSVLLLGGKSYSNLFRIKQSYGDDSYIGAMVTDRRTDDRGSNSVLSADGRLYFHPRLRLQWQAIGSHCREPRSEDLTGQLASGVRTGLIPETFGDRRHTAAFDGESYWGHAFVFDLQQRSRKVQFDITYHQYSPTYRSDIGFQTFNDRRILDFYAGYDHLSDHGLIQRINPQVLIGRVWNYRDQPKDEYIWMNLVAHLRFARTRLRTTYARSAETYVGVHYPDMWTSQQQIEMSPWDFLSFHVRAGHGHNVARRFFVPDRETWAVLSTQLKPIDRVIVDTDYSYHVAHHRTTGQRLFEGFIVRSCANYQFNRELSARLVVQYNDYSRAWDFDPLVTYRLSPFSVLYAGSTYDYCEFDDGENRTTTVLGARQFFVKLQYLFQI